MLNSLRVEQLLRHGVHEGVAPAIGLGVLAPDLRETFFAGALTPEVDAPAAGPSTRFDLASLTKPLTTLTWCLRLVAESRLELGAPIGDLVEVGSAALGAAPLHRLLNHTSGLPAHRAYFRGLAAAARAGRHAGRDCPKRAIPARRAAQIEPVSATPLKRVLACGIFTIHSQRMVEAYEQSR